MHIIYGVYNARPHWCYHRSTADIYSMGGYMWAGGYVFMYPVRVGSTLQNYGLA